MKPQTLQSLMKKLALLLEKMTHMTLLTKMETGAEWKETEFTDHPAYREAYMGTWVDVHSGCSVEHFRQELKLAEANAQYERCAGIKLALELYLSGHPQSNPKSQNETPPQP